MPLSNSDRKVFRALEFARRHTEVEPIISAILRNFSPSQLQEYSGVLSLHLSSNRSYIFRNVYEELFPRLIPDRQLCGLSVFVIGKDLQTLSLRILSPQNPEARLGMSINLGIVVRDTNGQWPPNTEDLKEAINCLGASREEIKNATAYNNASDTHSLCCTLLSLLVTGSRIDWAIGASNALHQPDFRLIWLDGSIEMLIDLQRGRKRWTTESTLLRRSSASAASLLLEGEAGRYSATVTCLNRGYRKNMELIPCSHSTSEDLNGKLVFISEGNHYVGEEYVSIDLRPVCTPNEEYAVNCN